MRLQIPPSSCMRFFAAVPQSPLINGTFLLKAVHTHMHVNRDKLTANISIMDETWSGGAMTAIYSEAIEFKFQSYRQIYLEL